jgi:hypothetical protein
MGNIEATTIPAAWSMMRSQRKSAHEVRLSKSCVSTLLIAKWAKYMDIMKLKESLP